MTPEQLPQWLDYALSENTAAAMFRGLRGLSARWGELIAAAQAVMGLYQDLPSDSAEQLYDEQNALPLIAASRILDAASQHPSALPEEERQYLAVVAAVAFGMYGNFLSASAVVRRERLIPPLDSPSMAVILATAAPHCLGEMLWRCASSSPEKTYLELLEAFLSTGEARRIEPLREALIRCLLAAPTPFEGGLLRSIRLCLDHLCRLSVAKTLREHCPLLPEAYIRKLLDSGVRVLLPPQFKAIARHRLLTSAENAIVALPTSTGKTLLGELCLVAALQRQSGIACYLAPYVALGRQVADSIEEHVPDTFRVHRMLGGFREEDALALDHGMGIIIATPERLDAMLRATPGLIAHLRCVVCDEAHLVQNGVRGVRLEGLMTRMRLLQEAGYPLRLVVLSAVLSRYDVLRQWLAAPGVAVITDSWKPTARRLAFWRERGSLTWYVGDDPIRRPGITSNATIGQQELPWPENGFYATTNPGQLRKQEPLVHTNVAYLAEVLTQRYGGSILCVCATRDSTRKVAAALAIRFPRIDPLPQSISAAIDQIEKRHRFLLPLCDLLRRGVAFHNSTVPYPIRQSIEDAVRKRDLIAVAATTTLAEGVDLPFRFTILVDWLTWQEGKQRPISSLLFRNVAGRCGRAGVFTEGDTIVFDNPLGEPTYTSPPRRARVQSEIFLAEQPEELASALESLTEASAPASEESLHGGLAAQFMAAIPENPEINNLVEAFAEQMFLTHRLSSSDWIHHQLTEIANDLLNETNGALAVAASPLHLTPFGQAANATGFSPQSCRQIAAFLRQNRTWGATTLTNLAELASDLLRALGTLPEQTHQDLRKVLKSRSSRVAVKPDDFQRVLDSWLGGVPLEYIFADLPYVLRSTRTPRIQAWLSGSSEASGWNAEFDKFVDFIRAVFGDFLPWLMRACARLSMYTGGWSTQVPWGEWADNLERRIEPT
jgi:helicase